MRSKIKTVDKKAGAERLVLCESHKTKINKKLKTFRSELKMKFSANDIHNE